MNPRNRIWCSDLSMNQGEQNSFLTWIPLHLFLAVLVSLFHYFSFVSKKSFIFYCLRILRVWGETAVLGCRGSGWILSSQTCLVMTLSKLLCLSRLQCPSPPPTLSTHTHTHTHTHTVSTWGQSCRSCLKGGPCMHHPQVPCQFWSSSTFFSLFPESFCFHDLLTLVHYICLIPVFVQLQTWRGKTGEMPLCWAPTSSANQSLLVKTLIVSGSLKSPVNSCCGL